MLMDKEEWPQGYPTDAEQRRKIVNLVAILERELGGLVAYHPSDSAFVATRTEHRLVVEDEAMRLHGS